MLPSTNRRETNLPGFSDSRAVRPSFSAGQTARTLQKLVSQPSVAWLEFSRNGKSFQKLFEEYVFALAAIPAISGFIGSVLFGEGKLLYSLGIAILSYIMSLVFVYAATWFAYGTVKIFNGAVSLNHSAGLVIYSLLPFFVCGLFLLHPTLAPLALFGSYSFFLFFQGLQEMTNIPAEKRLTYSVLNIVAWVLFVDRMLAMIF